MYSKPTIYNIPLTSSTVIYSQALPANTKKVYLKERSMSGDIKIAFEGTLATFATVNAGQGFNVDMMHLRGETLYMQGSADGLVAELIVFTD